MRELLAPSAAREGGDERQAAAARWGSLALGLLLVLLPHVLVRFPPVTDLPQQTAQLRLLEDGGAEYRVQWWHPNKLGYLPLAVAWGLVSPEAAGRLGMAILAVLWVAAVHLLAAQRRRDPVAALLASTLLFSHVYYWGLLNFLIGFPVFVLWWLGLERGADPGRPSGAVTLIVGSFLLYSAHVLWLAVGLLTLLLHPGMGWRLRFRSLLWLAPVLLLVGFWYPRLAAAGFQSETTWGRAPWQRLDPRWLVNCAWGGLRSEAEAVVGCVLVLWIGLGWASRMRLHAGASPSDPGLTATGAAFLGLALVLPGVLQHTILFASRWVPVAGVFLALGAPPPHLSRRLGALLVAVVVAGHGAATVAAWRGWNDEELAGLAESLQLLPEGGRLLGLDYIRTSPRIQAFPYYHLHAYAQLLRGSTLARSFASEASSLVVFADSYDVVPWTPNLDWRPERLRHSDLGHFDHLLLHAEPDVADRFLTDPRLEPLTPPARWRLFEIRGSEPGPGVGGQPQP